MYTGFVPDRLRKAPALPGTPHKGVDSLSLTSNALKMPVMQSEDILDEAMPVKRLWRLTKLKFVPYRWLLGT